MLVTQEPLLVRQEQDFALQWRVWTRKVILRTAAAFLAGALLLPAVTGIHVPGAYVGGGLCGAIAVLIVETSALFPPFVPLGAGVVLLLKVLGPILNCASRNPMWLGSPNRLSGDASEIAGFTLYASLAILMWLAAAMIGLWPVYRQAAQSQKLGTSTSTVSDAGREKMLTWFAWGAVALGSFANLFDSYYWGLPSYCHQVVHQLSNVRFVGCAYLIMRRRSWLAPAAAVGLSIIPLIRSTLLISAFGTIILLYCFIAHTALRKYTRFLLHAGIGTVILVLLSAVKYDMRTDFGRLKLGEGEHVKWDEMGRIRRELPGYYLSGQARPFGRDKVFRVLKRLDEGTVLGMTMRWTGKNIPFAKGRTLWRALYSAVVPRVLDPRKQTAGGAENYVRYAGGSGYGHTSINIGQIGEFYANFGYWGGLLAYALEGLLFGVYIRLMHRVLRRDPLGIAWFAMLLGGIGDIGIEVFEFVGSLAKAFFMAMFLRWTMGMVIRKQQRGYPLRDRRSSHGMSEGW